MIRRDPGCTGESTKLLPHYKGPYMVTEVLPNDRYRVADFPEMQRTQRFYEGVVAADDMKRVMPPPDTIDGDTTDDENSQPRRSARNRRTPKYLNDYEP